MTMIGFLARRAAGAMVLVFAVTSGALLLAQLAPGDYASQFGQNAGQIAAERHRLGLDLPIGRQYARWLKRSITLDLGESFQYQRPVTALVGERALNTAKLAAAALVVATLIGIPWGVVTGSRRGLLIHVLRGAVQLVKKGRARGARAVLPLQPSGCAFGRAWPVVVWIAWKHEVVNDQRVFAWGE